MSDEALAATTNPEPAVSLTDILKAVQIAQHEAKKAHDLEAKRFEKLFKHIGELGERMDTIDQSIQNALPDFLPVNTQLRVSSQTRTDSNPSLSLSVARPQAQAHPIQDQQLPAAAPMDLPTDDEEIQTRPRRNHTRKKSSAAKENPSTSTTNPPQASNKEPKPSFAYEYSITNRALPPSPPRIGKARSSKPKVNRPVKSSARRKSKEDSDDGIDEIPAVAEEHKVNKTGKKQQKPKPIKKTGDREAAHDFDDGEVALGAEENDDNDEAPKQVAKPNKKRKTSRADPIGDAEGRPLAQIPGAMASADVHADEDDEPHRPKKKGKKSKQVE